MTEDVSPGIDDERLAELVHEWRSRAARGESMALGVAEAFKAEQSRRERDRLTQIEKTSKQLHIERGPWWRFWSA